MRCRVNSGRLPVIMEKGMNSDVCSVVREVAFCMFSFRFNGRRESSVAPLPAIMLQLATGCMTARLTVVKGKPVKKQQLVSFTALTGRNTPFPLELWRKITAMRGSHLWYYALECKPVAYLPQMLTRALTRCRDGAGIWSPRGARFPNQAFRLGHIPNRFY